MAEVSGTWSERRGGSDEPLLCVPRSPGMHGLGIDGVNGRLPGTQVS